MKTHICIPALGAALSFFASSAMADITAADLWTDWQEIAATSGATLTAGESVETSDGLTLRDVSVVLDYPEGGMSGTIPEIVMTESGGSVTVTVSEEYRMDMTVAPEDGPEGTFALVIRQPGARMVASGSPEDVTYDFTFPTLAMTMDGAEFEDEEFDMRLAVEMTGMAGTYRTTEGDMRRIESAFTADGLAAALNVEAPDDSGGTVEMTATVADLVSNSSGTLSTLGAMGDLAALLRAGLSSEGDFRHGALSYRLVGSGPDGDFTVDGTTETGTLDFVMSQEGLSYGATNTGVTMQIGVAGIPFGPITIGMEESGGRVTMPIAASDEPGDLALVLRLVGITISDPVWMLFDPTGVLPRDPATVIIDLSGEGNWMIDILDPEAIEAAEEMPEVPGQIESVTLNELVIDAVGARVSGTGAFTFDNSGPVPDPSGSVELTIDGANALIDRLVAMGIVPQDQAMGAQMMLGLFARPVGDDQLESVIEVQPGGAVLANGQRIR